MYKKLLMSLVFIVNIQANVQKYYNYMNPFELETYSYDYDNVSHSKPSNAIKGNSNNSGKNLRCDVDSLKKNFWSGINNLNNYFWDNFDSKKVFDKTVNEVASLYGVNLKTSPLKIVTHEHGVASVRETHFVAGYYNINEDEIVISPEILSDGSLKSVLAHELAHRQCYHIEKMQALISITAAACLAPIFMVCAGKRKITPSLLLSPLAAKFCVDVLPNSIVNRELEMAADIKGAQKLGVTNYITSSNYRHYKNKQYFKPQHLEDTYGFYEHYSDIRRAQRLLEIEAAIKKNPQAKFESHLTWSERFWCWEMWKKK